MIKGTLYLAIIAMIIITCILGETKYYVRCERLRKKHINPVFFVSRYETYPIALMIVAGISAFIAAVIGMYNTWNDPI